MSFHNIGGLTYQSTYYTRNTYPHSETMQILHSNLHDRGAEFCLKFHQNQKEIKKKNETNQEIEEEEEENWMTYLSKKKAKGAKARAAKACR